MLISLPDRCFSLDISSTLLSSVELFHSALSKVVERTYLGMLFMTFANGSSAGMEGQKAAKS